MKKRECYLSLARVICALAVVMIHTNGCFNEFNLNSCWISGNVIDCGLGFAVPIFIMISGATLIDYSERYSTKEYFIKRIEKTLVPYLIWSCIGMVYEKVTETSGTFFIYYFFLNLFGIYLCIPLFSFIKQEYKEKVILYLVIISFLINYLIPFVCEIIGITYVYKVPFEVASNYLIYALVGYLIAKKEVTVKWRLLSYICGIAGFVLHIGGTYVMSVREGYIVNIYRGYTNLPCFLSAVGIFILIKQVGQMITNEKVVKLIDSLSKYTFSVYLMHFFVINSFIKIVFDDTHSLWYRMGTPFLTFSICVLISWIIRKIPLIGNLIVK